MKNPWGRRVARWLRRPGVFLPLMLLGFLGHSTDFYLAAFLPFAALGALPLTGIGKRWLGMPLVLLWAIAGSVNNPFFTDAPVYRWLLAALFVAHGLWFSTTLGPALRDPGRVLGALTLATAGLVAALPGLAPLLMLPLAISEVLVVKRSFRLPMTPFDPVTAWAEARGLVVERSFDAMTTRVMEGPRELLAHFDASKLPTRLRVEVRGPARKVSVEPGRGSLGDPVLDMLVHAEGDTEVLMDRHEELLPAVLEHGLVLRDGVVHGALAVRGDQGVVELLDRAWALAELAEGGQDEE